jgi:cell division protein FtsB
MPAQFEVCPFAMRLITLILVVLLLLLQYPLWLGKGGWLRVWDLNKQVAMQQQINSKTQERNALLDAEVRDLKQGTDAIEERARSELGMIKSDEVFFSDYGLAASSVDSVSVNSAASH